MTVKQLFFVASLLPLLACATGKDIEGNDITRDTKLGYVDGELTTVGDIADFSKGGGASTNAVRAIVDDSFVGGTQEVNRVTGSFDAVSNRVAVIESKEEGWDAKQDAIADYTTTQAVKNVVAAEGYVNALQSTNIAQYVAENTKTYKLWSDDESRYTTQDGEIFYANKDNRYGWFKVFDSATTNYMFFSCITNIPGVSDNMYLWGKYDDNFVGYYNENNRGNLWVKLAGHQGWIQKLSKTYDLTSEIIPEQTNEGVTSIHSRDQVGYITRFATTNELALAISEIDLSSRTTFEQASNIVESVAVTNLGAIAYVNALVDSANPTFSNQVLAVGLNIDTNSVAALNAIVDGLGGFPIEGTATTVGGLLAALAAAIAWLKKNKVNTTTLNDKFYNLKTIAGSNAAIADIVAALGGTSIDIDSDTDTAGDLATQVGVSTSTGTFSDVATAEGVTATDDTTVGDLI